VTNPTLNKKGALTTHIKKAHNISNNITKKELMAISTNIESDNNNKNIKVDKLEVELVAVVTKEPTTSILL
jgi:hypothetical protein